MLHLWLLIRIDWWKLRIEPHVIWDKALLPHKLWLFTRNNLPLQLLVLNQIGFHLLLHSSKMRKLFIFIRQLLRKYHLHFIHMHLFFLLVYPSIRVDLKCLGSGFGINFNLVFGHLHFFFPLHRLIYQELLIEDVHFLLVFHQLRNDLIFKLVLRYLIESLWLHHMLQHIDDVLLHGRLAVRNSESSAHF